MFLYQLVINEYTILRRIIVLCVLFVVKSNKLIFISNGSNNTIMVAGSGHLQRSQSFTQCGGQSLPPCSS